MRLALVGLGVALALCGCERRGNLRSGADYNPPPAPHVSNPYYDPYMAYGSANARWRPPVRPQGNHHQARFWGSAGGQFGTAARRVLARASLDSGIGLGAYWPKASRTRAQSDAWRQAFGHRIRPAWIKRGAGPVPVTGPGSKMPASRSASAVRSPVGRARNHDVEHRDGAGG